MRVDVRICSRPTGRCTSLLKRGCTFHKHHIVWMLLWGLCQRQWWELCKVIYRDFHVTFAGPKVVNILYNYPFCAFTLLLLNKERIVTQLSAYINLRVNVYVCVYVDVQCISMCVFCVLTEFFLIDVYCELCCSSINNIHF